MIGDDEEVPAMHLGGYCPVSLVERFGVLVPADPSIGLVGVRGRVFGCASESQLGDFRLQPLVYLSAAQDAVRRAPEVRVPMLMMIVILRMTAMLLMAAASLAGACGGCWYSTR